MKWLKKRAKKNVSNPVQKENSQSNTFETPVSCSKPVKTYIKQLTSDTLKKFVPLRNLVEHRIELIPHTTQVVKENSVLFIQGHNSDHVYYLLEGTVVLQPDSDSHYQVSFDHTRARLPLNSGKICGATATARTDVTLLVISSELNQLWADKRNNDFSCIELIDLELPKEINDQRFFNSFAQAYRENKLSLPSLPDVAFKLKEAVANDIGVNEAVEIIHLDPPIVTKLIQVANSALYAPVTPITNCHDAVTRLGLDATRSLVMSISLKQLFKCKDKQLIRGMQSLWERSLYVSSLSFVLASEMGTINPEDALLAGLITDF